jgi:KipI family sensor histidine kinase inhibitor
MSTARTVISSAGDAALRIVAALDDREANWRLTHHLARHLDEAEIPGLVCTIPTYDALLVELDPAGSSRDRLIRFLEHIIDSLDVEKPLVAQPQHFRVPVLYDPEYAPDLLDVAAAQGLSVDQVIEIHSAPRYTVRCLGSPGGSPMLDGPSFPRPIPRLSSPRPSVPQGAVSVAGRQATITPAVAPGGWALIGRTPLTILDLTTEPFVPYQPGDYISFHQIDRTEFEDRLGERLAAA